MSGSEKENNKDRSKKADTRRVATVKQIDYLIDFLHDNDELRCGRVRSREAVHMIRQLWDVCTEKLNRLGPSRNSKEWAKYWSDLKCRVKLKATEVDKRAMGAGEGSSSGSSLSSAEKRIAELMEQDRLNKRSREITRDGSGSSSLESVNCKSIKEEKDDEIQIQEQDMNIEDFISTTPVVLSEHIAPSAKGKLPSGHSPSHESAGNVPVSGPFPQLPLPHQLPSANGVESGMQLSPIHDGPSFIRVQTVPPGGVSTTPKRRRRRPRVIQTHPVRSCGSVQCTNCTELKELANIMLKLEESHAKTTRLQTEASLKMTEVLKLQAEGIMHTGVALREMANNLCRLLEGQMFSNRQLTV